MKLANVVKKNLPELQYILVLFLSTRLVLTVIGVLARSLLERQYGKQYIYSNQLWLDIWGVWDSYWYINIAKDGYSAEIGTSFSKTQANYAFFPLYPMLMRLIGTILGNKYYIAGIIVSNVCLLVACFFLYKLIKLKLDPNISLRSLKYLIVAPTAFILSGVFTESLYLMLAVFCFYFAAKRQWLLVGIAGFFLALTRSIGFLMLVPMLYEYLQSKEFQWKKVKYDVLFLLLIPLGLLLFALYNYHLTGSFVAFSEIQAGWRRSLSNPLSVLFNGFREGLFRPNVRILMRMKALIEATFSLAALGLLCLSFRKIWVSYWIFALYSILIPLSTGLESMPRYILPIFPLYIVLAKFANNRELDQAITLFFGLLQGALMVFWSCGYSLVI
jgi:hypothetical protein